MEDQEGSRQRNTLPYKNNKLPAQKSSFWGISGRLQPCPCPAGFLHARFSSLLKEERSAWWWSPIFRQLQCHYFSGSWIFAWCSSCTFLSWQWEQAKFSSRTVFCSVCSSDRLSYFQQHTSQWGNRIFTHPENSIASFRIICSLKNKKNKKGGEEGRAEGSVFLKPDLIGKWDKLRPTQRFKLHQPIPFALDGELPSALSQPWN